MIASIPSGSTGKNIADIIRLSGETDFDFSGSHFSPRSIRIICNALYGLQQTLHLKFNDCSFEHNDDMLVLRMNLMTMKTLKELELANVRVADSVDGIDPLHYLVSGLWRNHNLRKLVVNGEVLQLHDFYGEDFYGQQNHTFFAGKNDEQASEAPSVGRRNQNLPGSRK